MTKKEPERRIKFGKGIVATIWKNDTEKGVWYSVAVEQRYKQGDTWKTASAYFSDDALLVAQAFETAYRWVLTSKNKQAS